jgi:hypothetical protein
MPLRNAGGSSTSRTLMAIANWTTQTRAARTDLSVIEGKRQNIATQSGPSPTAQRCRLLQGEGTYLGLRQL